MKIIKFSGKLSKKNLPLRINKDNKTRGGKCLVIAGSKGMFGSAILTCLASARSGAGYTYLLSSGHFPIERHPDFLFTKVPPSFSKFQAIAMGPGFQNPTKIKSYLKTLLNKKIKNVVLDAEALNVLAKSIQKLPLSWVITPHEGELSKILKIPSPTIRKNRLKYILIAQKKLGCIVLLKGYKTLVTDGKSVWEIQSGNPALAKAGTGDVLTGMILAFMSQGLEPLMATNLAAYIHGLIADNWVKSGKDILSLMASDIIDLIPKTLSVIRKK